MPSTETRRRLLAALGAVSAGAISGCLSQSLQDEDVDPDDSEPSTNTTTTISDATTIVGPLDWQTSTDGDADAKVVTDGTDDADALNFRVNGCSNATARAALGETTGRLRIDFDYRITAEAWYEIPYVEVYEDDALVYTNKDDPFNDVWPEAYETVTGSVDTTVDVNGNVRIVIGLRPSRYCDNGDHGDTLFQVDDLDVNLGPTTTTSSANHTADWKTATEGGPVAEALSDDHLRFRVDRCSTARATRTLDSVSGQLHVEFDYEVSAEGWYEQPFAEVYEDDELVYSVRSDDGSNIGKEEYGSTTGTVDATVPVDGEVNVVLGIRPSQHCENADHGETVFEVRNLRLETSDGP